MEYESRRDADDAYHEMHNKRIGRDDMLKIEVPHDLSPNKTATGVNQFQWARTPPSASWRFDSGREPGRDRGPGGRRERSPRRGGRSPSPPRRGRGDYSPRKDDRRERDYDRRDRDRSRSPDDRDREMKDVRDRHEDDERENGTNGEDRKGKGSVRVTLARVSAHWFLAPMDSPIPAHDELDTAE